MSTLKTEINEDLELFESIHYFYIKNQKEIKNNYNDNIIIKYLKEPKIIKDSNNLVLFIEQLLKQIQKGNNLILPFINPLFDLIDIYINNNDNIYKQIFLDNQIFIQLIENSFFNRKNLIPIYAYFTELYSDVNIIESDEKLEKFVKCVNLWKIFYFYKDLNYYSNINQKSFSSFCFLGTGLEILGINEIPDNINLELKINFLNNKFFKYINMNDDIISIKDRQIKYSILSEYQSKENDSLNFIFYNFDKNKILEIIIKNKIIFSEKINLKESNISILNNFYGQIKNIEIGFFKKFPGEREKNIFSRIISPFPLKNNEGKIFYSSFQFNNKNNIKLQSNFNDNKINIGIIIKDIDLVKVNYINYKEENFNIIDYFGGITHFLPFLNIINGLYRNENIIKINNIEKEYFLIDFAKSILLIIYNYINISGIKKQENFKKYWIFYLYILNKIEPFQNIKEKIDINEFQSFNSDIYKNNENFFEIFKLFLNYINTKDKLIQLKDLIIKLYFERNEKLQNLSLFGKSNNQLYKGKMKQLFIYNRIWSKQYLFFKHVYDCYKNNKDNNSKIKYKRINYYTCNFQQPLIYPILEIKNYYPFFQKFKIENLYKNPQDKIVNYNFSLDNFKNILNENLVNTFLDNHDISKDLKCCLIKKLYHIKGFIIALEISDSDFQIFFSSNNKDDGEKCNKNIYNQNVYNSNLCYGSVFPCLEKDKKRLLFIPKHKIMFVLLRIYYFRPTGLEVFTSDNKSYYFNFWTKLNFNGRHPLLKLFEKNFSEIKEDNIILGWYNPFYSRILTPLFNEKIFKWNEKKYYYSNFDQLMIINLFSNRSFNDLIQYPIFPMLYKEIGKERELDQHIGFQDLNEESKERKKLIIDTYSYKFNEEEDLGTEDNEIFFFTLFYSNIVYTCNYLIRLFPYSFIAIEYQGDGFDDPNRLFFSINSTFHNTLEQKSDFRELIPEIFYFPSLFYNKNELQLNKFSNGNDDAKIHDQNENKLRKYIFLKDIRNNLEESKINHWIDLIFGIKKDYNDKKERYYDIKSNISFEPGQNILNDSISLQSCDFGVLPYQILKEKFPEKPKISHDLEQEIYKLNKRNFIREHINCLIDGKESFICIGEKGISKEYLTIINKIKKENNNTFGQFLNYFYNNEKEIKENENLNYLFVGDVFGNLSVYIKNKSNTKSEINSCGVIKSIEKEIIDKINEEYNLLKSINDHTEEIKYIDYNPRLNMLIDYSLDGYINLYIMPTLKLIHVIQIKDFNINENINSVALISNPFPMICCISIKNIIVFDINGELINKLDIMDNKTFFCIDKNCGLFNDYISYWKDRKEIKYNLFAEKFTI